MPLGVDHRSKYAAAPDDVLAGTRLDVEDEETTLVFDKTRVRLNGCAGRYCLQVIHFDPRADCDDAGRQVRSDGLHAGELHQSDHGRS